MSDTTTPTKNESLPELPAKWRTRADAISVSGTWSGDFVAGFIRDCADDLQSALTREAPTEGVTDEMVERACKRYAFREDGATWPDAYSEHEVAAERVLMREFLEHVLATPPAPQRQPNAVDDLIEAVANACMRSSKRHGAAGYQDDMNRLYAAVYRLKPEGIDGPLADRVPDSLEAALSRLPRGAK